MSTLQKTDGRRNEENEVLISGLDTGPTPAERTSLSPTEERITLSPETDQQEPEDEDG